MEFHHLAGEVLDRADLVEQLPEAFLHEPVERFELEFDQVGDFEDFGDPRVTPTGRDRGSARGLNDRQHEPLLDGGGRGRPRSQKE
jgi:hypothetical protein